MLGLVLVAELRCWDEMEWWGGEQISPPVECNSARPVGGGREAKCVMKALGIVVDVVWRRMI